jgi:hypothetical protein
MISRLKSRRGAVVAIGMAAFLGSLLLGAYGGSASGTEPKLSWYACVQGGGKHGYEDSNCTKANATGPFWWAPVTNRSFTSASTSEYRLGWTAGGVIWEINCSGANGSGTLTGNETGAGMENTFNMTGCWPIKPAGLGCKITGEGITMPLKGSSPVSPETLNPEMRLSIATGTSFFLEGCSIPALNGVYNLSGWFPGQVNNSQMSMSTTAEESKGKLKVSGASGWIEGSSSLLATGFWWGSSGVKLATAP